MGCNKAAFWFSSANSTEKLLHVPLLLPFGLTLWLFAFAMVNTLDFTAPGMTYADYTLEHLCKTVLMVIHNPSMKRAFRVNKMVFPILHLSACFILFPWHQPTPEQSFAVVLPVPLSVVSKLAAPALSMSLENLSILGFGIGDLDDDFKSFVRSLLCCWEVLVAIDKLACIFQHNTISWPRAAL